MVPSATHARTRVPVFARASTSSMSTRASASRIGSSSLLCAMKSSKACAVVANPPGTRTPVAASWLISSPSDAFFPPTEATSVMRSDSRATT